MWGTQVMQRLAGEVRVAENAIVRAEKMAAYARLYKGMEWLTERIDEGWRTLLLSQHHDRSLQSTTREKDMGGDGYGLDWGDQSKQPSDN